MKLSFYFKTNHLSQIVFFCFILLFCFFPSQKVSAQTRTAPLVVDHTSVSLFTQIPSTYIDAARNTSMFYTDRSVGDNLTNGLDCLSSVYTSALYYCKKYTHVVPEFSVQESDIIWQGSYPRPNWAYVICTATSCTISQYNSTPVQALGYFTSYLESDDGTGETFANQVISQMSAFESTHPNVNVIYFTSSLARGSSDQTRIFNNRIRTWARANNKILFDAADILSHDIYGNPCFDNRDGVQYCNINQCEGDTDPASVGNPDDGINTPAICQQYTTEADGGHLGSASVGMIRLSKAVWVLMAQVAGWIPGSVSPPPTSQPTSTLTPTRTPTPSLQQVLSSVEVQVPYYEFRPNSAVGISALGYDQSSNPIWSGITYEWGASSIDTNASVSPVYSNITNITALKPGNADIWVIARQGSRNVRKSFQITILPPPPCVPLGNIDCNSTVNLIDLSMLLSKFGQSGTMPEDIDQNRTVNLIDLSILLSNFGKSN
jgi:hypothetical protein